MLPAPEQTETCPHLRRVIDDEEDKITLLRKANEQRRSLV